MLHYRCKNATPVFGMGLPTLIMLGRVDILKLLIRQTL